MLKYDDPLDGVFKALADGARRAILEQLTRGEATMSDLAGPLAISLPAVHQHIALLEGAGLVQCEKRGRARWCRLDRPGFKRAARWIADREKLWERRLDALDAHLRNEKRSKPS
jgi:DNA-binding transcriptional ArsR family regulator